MTKPAPFNMMRWAESLFTDDEENEPGYDPVHLGGAVIITLTAIGCLYWLLWTLLVFEGGIFVKAAALAKVLFTKTTLRDLGYEGAPYAMGAFEGWLGNVLALLLCGVVAFALRRLYLEAERKQRPRK